VGKRKLKFKQLDWDYILISSQQVTLGCCTSWTIIFHWVKEKTLPPKGGFTTELLTEVSTYQPSAVSEDRGDDSQRRSFEMVVGRGEAAESAHRRELATC